MAIKVIPWEKASFNDFLLFHHLPKTAGTAVSSALGGLYGPGNYKWFHGPYGALEEIANGTKLKAAGGHFHLNHHKAAEVNKEMIMFAVFRDPVDRVISSYYYFRANGTHNLNPIANQYTLAEIYKQGLGKKMQVQNQITHMLATARGGATYYEALDSAKETANNYTFFGIQEQIEALEHMIKRLFGLDKFTVPKLIAKTGRPRIAEVDPETLDLIREYNSYDIDLYSYAKEVYEKKLRTEWL